MLTPGRASVLAGDISMTTKDRPSLHNQGQTTTYLRIQFEPLVGRGTGRQIVDFGLVYKGERVSVRAGKPVCLAAELKPGEKARLDFIVNTPLSAPSDNYIGGITIIAAAHPGAGEGRCPG